MTLLSTTLEKIPTLLSLQLYTLILAIACLTLAVAYIFYFILVRKRLMRIRAYSLEGKWDLVAKESNFFGLKTLPACFVSKETHIIKSARGNQTVFVMATLIPVVLALLALCYPLYVGLSESRILRDQLRPALGTLPAADYFLVFKHFLLHSQGIKVFLEHLYLLLIFSTGMALIIFMAIPRIIFEWLQNIKILITLLYKR